MFRPTTFAMVMFLATAIALLARGTAAQAPGTAAPAASRVAAEVQADTTAMAAGKPFLAAVTLTTSPDWHIYWSYPGEAGLATSFSWKAPDGFKVEPLAFPLPVKFIQSGGANAFGYTGKTTFLFRITPADALPPTKPGPSAMTVAASWLCCNKDQCVPSDAELELTLPQGEPKPANEALFKAAQEALPAANPPMNVFAMVSQPWVRGAKQTPQEEWTVQLGWAKAVAGVEIFPPAVEGLRVTVKNVETAPGQPRQGLLMAVNRQLDGSTMVDLKVHVLAGQEVKVEKIPLLVVYTMADGARKGFYLPLNATAFGLTPKP